MVLHRHKFVKNSRVPVSLIVLVAVAVGLQESARIATRLSTASKLPAIYLLASETLNSLLAYFRQKCKHISFHSTFISSNRSSYSDDVLS